VPPSPTSQPTVSRPTPSNGVVHHHAGTVPPPFSKPPFFVTICSPASLWVHSKHKKTYFFKKMDSLLQVAVERQPGSSAVSLCVSPSAIPANFRQRLYNMERMRSQVSRIRERRESDEPGGGGYYSHEGGSANMNRRFTVRQTARYFTSTYRTNSFKEIGTHNLVALALCGA
jgi:hypothetical protein